MICVRVRKRWDFTRKMNQEHKSSTLMSVSRDKPHVHLTLLFLSNGIQCVLLEIEYNNNDQQTEFEKNV